jgi:hypothetical protein
MTMISRQGLKAIATASLLFAAGAVYAQDQAQPQGAAPAAAPKQPMTQKEKKAAFEAKFRAADADHDGKLTRAEADAGMPELAKVWDKVDTKKKGYLTEKQIEAAYGAVSRRRAATSDYTYK